jgi:para-aminobenzoate synthetase component 1
LRSATHTALALREIQRCPEPLPVFETLRSRALPWLLDSALRSPRLGRYSFAGADPWLVLRVRGTRTEIECLRAALPCAQPGRWVEEGDPLALLRRWLPRLDPGQAAHGLPFAGGAVGYLGYELADRFEALSPAPPDDAGLADAVLLLVDRVLAWDHESGRAFAVGLGMADAASGAQRAARAAAAQAEAWLSQPRPARGRGRRPAPPRPAFAFFDESSYGKAVDAILEEVAAGRVYQACLTHRIECDFDGDPWELYRRLRRLNPAPFACYLELPEVVVVGSSPERCLRVDAQGLVESRPIKGTRPRGRHACEDVALRAQLEASEKDRAENLMIVDLVRNDLGRACATGSVAVPELMAVEEYAAVFQMVSSVTGRLRRDCDALDLVRASFPPGSMTGAPKISAMQLLRRLEPVRRGIYSGVLGYFDARGGADLSVVIRTLLLREGRAYLHTGGGVVADSIPGEEWRESLDKARPLLAALGARSLTRDCRGKPGRRGASLARRTRRL